MNDIASYFQRYLFIGLLLIGGILSCVVRAVLENPLHGSVWAIVVCFICLSFLFAYYWSRRGDSNLHNPDNCYYMGLLFTLISLVYSLITLFLLNESASDVVERTYNLIGSFGIALISTLFGILYRILLLQRPGSMSSTHIQSSGERSEVGHQVHSDLTEAAFKLRKELTQTIADMSVFRGAIIQAVNETVREEIKARSSLLQQVEKSADEQIRVLSTLSTNAVEKLTKSIDEITDSVTSMKDPLDDLAGLHAEQARNIYDMSRKITSDGEKLANFMKSVVEPMQEIVRNLESTSYSVQAVSSNHDSLNLKLEKAINFFAEIEKEMEGSAKALTSSTKEFSRSLAEAAEVTPKYTQQFRKLITVLHNEVHIWNEITEDVREALVKIVKKLTKVIKGSS